MTRWNPNLSNAYVIARNRDLQPREQPDEFPTHAADPTA